jgi:hypothetical protein
MQAHGIDPKEEQVLEDPEDDSINEECEKTPANAHIL